MKNVIRLIGSRTRDLPASGIIFLLLIIIIIMCGSFPTAGKLHCKGCQQYLDTLAEGSAHSLRSACYCPVGWTQHGSAPTGHSQVKYNYFVHHLLKLHGLSP
jgi:hypothetical protein